MNRNVESHFATLPRADISRSRFDRSSSLKTSFNVGDIIPFYLDEVLPGDTFNVETSKVVRMQPMVTPIMDNIYLDTYYFFVPARLCWQHWKELNGENNESAWLPETEYEIPQITAPSGGWNVGTIADYFGIPTGVDNLSVNALPFRAYALICNEWFRDENLSDPLNIPLDDATVVGVNTGTWVTDVAKGGLPYKAAKYHDYFTSCLPAPQKGPDVMIPGGTGGNVPVYALSEQVPVNSNAVGSVWNTVSGSAIYGRVQAVEANDAYTFGQSYDDTNTYAGQLAKANIGPVNLWAVGDSTVATATINQLRLAFQIQKLYERDARGGTRYTEILKSHFGVTSPDSRLQRPEYLGGNRVPINVNQIVQQSATQDGSTPQGNPVGLSFTSDRNDDFIKSFTEHGYVIGLMVARYDHTYQQGLERLWTRKDRFDFYWPVFANIGEQAVLNQEIYAQGNDEDTGVFGYQEAWAEYRYKPNKVTGEMRSTYAQSLDVWHLADDYTQLPALSDSWIREDPSNVDRVLAISSSVSNQLFADIYVRNRSTRPMPVYSVPGLIDHH